MKVYPNPWFGGRGARAVVPKEPDGSKLRGWVGAKLDRELTKVTSEGNEATGQDRRQTIAYTFLGIPQAEVTPEKLAAAAPADVPNSAYYRQRVRHHELVPADAESARIGRVKWRPAVELLREAAGLPPVQTETKPQRRAVQSGGGDSQ